MRLFRNKCQSLTVIVTYILFCHIIIAKETGNIVRMLRNYTMCVNTYFGKQVFLNILIAQESY